MQTTPSLTKLILPRLNAVLFILLFLSALTVGSRMLNIDGDLPRHLLMGKVVLETHVPPTQEIFSYVYENEPYTPHEWLADVIYYLTYVLLGLNGVVFLAGILIASSFGFLYTEAVSQQAKYFMTLLLMLLGAFVTSIHWVTRPHLFTMLFLAIWIVLTDRLYRGIPVKLWIFPALMLLWANIHAEFIVGFLVLIAYLAGCAWEYLFTKSMTASKAGKNLLAVALFSFVASIFNPVGLKTWDIVVRYVNNRYLLSRIAETRPPDFTQAAYWPQLILLAIPVVLLVTRKVKFNPAYIFLMAGLGLISLLSARNAHLAGVVFPYVLSVSLVGISGFQIVENLETVIARMESQANGRLWYIVVLTILVSILVLAGPMGKFNRFEPSVFPVEAVHWLEVHPQSGRMFNAFDWGGYILFHLWPGQKTFIESQTDVRGEATQKYERVITLQDGWRDIFEEYNITWAIVPPNWPLAQELIRQGWKPAYQDQTAVILVKN